jgi:hypothetical protein
LWTGRVVRLLAVSLALAASVLATGCGRDHPAAGTPAVSPTSTATTAETTTPPAPDRTDAAGPLCALLSGADFRAVANLPAGATHGGGTETQATCEYGANLQLIVSVNPTTADADAFYQSMLRSAWFSSNGRRNPITGVDASTYGTSPDAATAALTLRRQRLVLTVVVPGPDALAALVQLASRALARAGGL